MNNAPPPSKKARTKTPCDDDIKSPKFFLDSFPKEILDNVLRFFSRIPKAKDWVPHIPLESIIVLYGVRGELGEFMIPRFNTLCISDSFKSNSSASCLWKERKGPMLWTKDLHAAHRFVLAGGGQSLHSIIVGDRIHSEDMETEIVDDFLSNCPNVKSLSIEDEGRPWISAHWLSRFGRQLEHLDISTVFSGDILKNCANLRELDLYLECHEVDFEIDEVIWEQIGGNLECLTLSGMYPEDHIESIKMHCRNLRRIRIYESEDLVGDFTQELISLLASFGGQLEYCHIQWMNIRQLTTISEACKNARFSTGVPVNNLIYPALKVLGPQLDKIAITTPSQYALDAGELTNACNACPNIRELAVFDCDIERAKAIVATPKKHVELLSISSHFKAEEKEMKKVLDIFSEGLVGVERIEYLGTQLPGNAFDKLISRNKSSLREFEVRFSGEISFENMATYLPLFLKCTELEVVCSNGISSNMLETLNSRGVEIYCTSKNPLYAQ